MGRIRDLEKKHNDIWSADCSLAFKKGRSPGNDRLSASHPHEFQTLFAILRAFRRIAPPPYHFGHSHRSHMKSPYCPPISLEEMVSMRGDLGFSRSWRLGWNAALALKNGGVAIIMKLQFRFKERRRFARYIERFNVGYLTWTHTLLTSTS